MHGADSDDLYGSLKSCSLMKRALNPVNTIVRRCPEPAVTLHDAWAGTWIALEGSVGPWVRWEKFSELRAIREPKPCWAHRELTFWAGCTFAGLGDERVTDGLDGLDWPL